VLDADGQVLALLTQDLPLLLLDDRTRAVVRIDDLVADLVQACLPFGGALS
jgi:hypothetical protein